MMRCMLVMAAVAEFVAGGSRLRSNRRLDLFQIGRGSLEGTAGAQQTMMASCVFDGGLTLPIHGGCVPAEGWSYHTAAEG